MALWRSLLQVDPEKEDPFAYCHHYNVTYGNRIDDQDHYNWCAVPNKGYDAVLFGGMAVVVAAMLQGKYAALWTLIAGGILQAVAMPVNTGPLGNAITLWLGIEPADLFLYVFLPPMLVDSAVRIDYFIFRKMLYHVLVFAFLMVILSTALMTPILLFVFDLRSAGWKWQHAALFAAIIAPTDAVSVSSILKKGGGLDKIVVLMEGESLFNDATSIVLFEIFFEMVKKIGDGDPGTEGTLITEGLHILGQIAWLTAGGLGIGLAFGWLTKWLLGLLRSGGAKAPEEMALTVAMAYLVFYLANAPAQVSGVIAVVVYGLYGSATAKWGLSPKVAESGTFDTFWDTIGFAIMGMVFFFSGVSSVNFFVRSAQELYSVEHFALKTVAITFWRLPVIFIAMFVVRGLLIMACNPIFKIADDYLPTPVVLFATFGGLRGTVSLILAQMLVTQQDQIQKSKDMLQTAQMSAWTAGVVVLTLLINAPMIPLVLKWTGLSQVSPVKAKIRAKAARAFTRYTSNAIDELRNDEDEMLRGVDWTAVAHFVDMNDGLHEFAHPQGTPQPGDAPSKQHPSAFRRLALRVADGFRAMVACLPLGSQDAQRDDQLAQPLLQEDEERGASQLDNIREVDLEAGEGTAADTEDADPLGDDEEDNAADDAASTPRNNRAVSSTGTNGGQVISKKDEQRILDQHHDNQFAEDVPFMGSESSNKKKSKDEADRIGLSDPGNIHTQDVHTPRPGTQDSTGGRPGRRFSQLQDQESNASLRGLRAQGSGLGSRHSLRLSLSRRSPMPVPSSKDKSQEAQAASSSVAGTTGQSVPSMPSASPESHSSQAQNQPQAESQADANARSQEARDSPFNEPASQHQVLPGREDKGADQDGENDNDLSSVTSTPLENAHSLISVLSDGSSHSVPWPIIIPHIIRPGQKGSKELPQMSWSKIDLQQLEQQKQHMNAGMTHQGANSQRTLRKMDTSKRKKGNRSASGKALTGHSKLDRSISGPLSVSAAAAAVADDNEEEEDLTNPASLAEEDEEGLSESEVLTEARIRLVSGLKRYFHDKRGRGLLSAEGVQLLDHACSGAADQPDKPISIWQNIEKDLCGGWGIAVLAHFLFLLRRYNVSRHQWSWGWLPLWIIVQWPTFKLAEVLGSLLSRTMLLSIEAAVEYWLSLTWSPQAQWLSDSAHDSPLRDEIHAESKKVWKFIIDREIEAPARFQAIQSYRAAMAILRQQSKFVAELYSSGMIDEQEEEQLIEPIQAQERRLQRNGAVWRAPRIHEVLRQLPFLQHLPQNLFDRLLRRSQLVKYKRGEVMWRPPTEDDDGEGSGVYIVMAGLVKSGYKTPDGDKQEFFLGSGGIFGLLQALTGEGLPGSAPYLAVGNALLQGPVVLHMPQGLVDKIKEKALAGDQGVVQLCVDMYRLAGLAVVDRLKTEVITAAITHYQHIALLQARRHIIKRIVNRHRMKHPDDPKSVDAIWARSKHSSAFRSIVSQEFERALQDLSTDVMQDEAQAPIATKPKKAAEEEEETKATEGEAKPEPAASGTWNPFRRNSQSKEAPPQDPKQAPNIDQAGAAGVGRPSLDGAGQSLGPSDQEILTSLPRDTIVNKMQHEASEALRELREGLRDALLLELEPGEQFWQESSVVLLRGQLLCTGCTQSVPLEQLPEGQGIAGNQPQGPFKVTLEYSGPAVMMWLWSNAHSTEDSGLRAGPIKHTAGGTGAVLMVCPPVPAILDLDPNDTSENVSEQPAETRGSWAASGETRDQLAKQRQMMADGNLRGFWGKQGHLKLIRLAGVSGGSELVAPSSAAQTSTNRLQITAVEKLD